MPKRISQIIGEVKTLEGWLREFYRLAVNCEITEMNQVFSHVLFSLFRIKMLLDEELWEGTEEKKQLKGRKKKK